MTTKTGWLVAYANDNDALIPEVWAQESLLFLEKNLIAALLVHRNFENEIKKFGDVVNTRRPAGFKAVRKIDGDAVTNQDAEATNVQIPLDQHLHTSFIIYDGEESKSMKDLMEFHALPAISSIAQSLDQVVLGELYNFMGGANAGRLGSDVTRETVIDTREAMTNNKCPLGDRRFLITPNVEGQLLNIEDLVNANTVGDVGSSLREGHIGRKYGFDFFTTQNAPTIAAGSTVQTGTLDGNHAAGATSVEIDITGAITRGLGAWMTIAGDMTPQYIVSGHSTTDNHTLVITPGLAHAATADAVVTIYTPGSINYASNYDSGYAKNLIINNFAVAPKVGQLVSLGTYKYGCLETPATPTTTLMTLTRALDAAAANTSNVGVGPAGDYCFAFNKNAVALITRPLAIPKTGTGVRSAVASYNGLSVRVTIGYDMTYQGHRVTLDILAGVKTLDTNLGAVMFA